MKLSMSKHDNILNSEIKQEQFLDLLTFIFWFKVILMRSELNVIINWDYFCKSQKVIKIY